MALQTFPGTLASLGAIREWVSRAAAEAGVQDAAIYDLCLAVDEMTTNTITHGYKKDGGELRLDAGVEPGRFTIRMEDDAPPFDPTHFAGPTKEVLESGLHQRAPGGLGIMLARRGVDELRYLRTERGNAYFFVLRLQRGAAR
jgi:anti-sigma regulatory factor (Ser/Thr protein kinase)